MKQMVYTKQRYPHGQEVILYDGVKDGYKFCILSYGTHPCAYVKIPKEHCCFGKDYMGLDIDCHGGLTYGRNYFLTCKETENEWWIGWDYAHCYDYMGYYEGDITCLERNSKKWSTEEIYSEVCDVIRQLKEMLEDMQFDGLWADGHGAALHLDPKKEIKHGLKDGTIKMIPFEKEQTEEIVYQE